MKSLSKPKTPRPEQALVLYSGGLDSRLVIKILQEQNFQITALHFNLPFGCSGCNLLEGLNAKEVKLKIFDVKSEPLLSEYLNIIKNPKHGTGTGINPCKDCKIFMFKKAKEYADKNKIKIIATGEVIGQRPMSQIPSAMRIIDEQLDFEILRPLCAKAIKETSYESSKLITRNSLLSISGRGRKEQMVLAEKYKIKYPAPGGGCFLCEKYPSIRLKHLLEKNLITESTLPLTTIGRHFYINNTWFVVARDEKESDIISSFKTHLPDDEGKPAIYYQQFTNHQSPTAIAKDLQSAYSTGDNKKERDKFSQYKL